MRTVARRENELIFRIEAAKGSGGYCGMLRAAGELQTQGSLGTEIMGRIQENI